MITEMAAMTGISAEEAADAFVKLSMALENGRKIIKDAPVNKFRVKSEEIEVDWIS